MKTLNKISKLTNQTYNQYIKKYSIKNLKSIGSENLKVKYLRYSIILNEILLNKKNKIKVLDVGCGMGDFYNFLIKKNLTKNIDYSGVEINKILLNQCLKKFNQPNKFYISDLLNIPPHEKYSWIILSGTFYHLPKNISSKEYFKYVKKVLSNSWKFADIGVVVNFLNEDVEWKIKKLFYPNYSSLKMFLNSLSRFNKQVSNYPMFETTYFVYKKQFIKKQFIKKEFLRYF